MPMADVHGRPRSRYATGSKQASSIPPQLLPSERKARAAISIPQHHPADRDLVTDSHRRLATRPVRSGRPQCSNRSLR